MIDCYLTERQKQMLSILIDGLENGYVRTDWKINYIAAVERIHSIVGLNEDEKLNAEAEQVWLTSTYDDFNSFIECGFMEEPIKTFGSSSRNIRLKKARIINFVKQDYTFDNEQEVANTSNPMIIDISVNSVFGSPQEDAQYECDVFVVMPFADDFTPIYTDHLKSTIEKLGYSIKRGDDFFSKHSIMTDVWSAIASAKLIIADCTGRNPNVFYELGMAHTLDKPVILIAQDMKDIPFDIRHLRVILYEETSQGMIDMQIELIDAIKKILGIDDLIRRIDGETFSELLNRARELRGLAMYEVDDPNDSHLARYYGRYEAGIVLPRVHLLTGLAKVLQIHLSDLTEACSEASIARRKRK